MADPTIQTFCCHHAPSHRNGNNNSESDVISRIMHEFNTDAYNIVCMFASALGIFGAIYQILPRRQYANNHRWLSSSATRGRKIIVWLAVADLLAAMGMFLRAALWLSFKNIMPALNDNRSVLFCALSSAWTQYFYTATWLWTLFYAIEMRRILSERDSFIKRYHFIAWTIPAATTSIGLSILYLPDANCHTTQTLSNAIIRILPNYLATYIPIVTVMIANPCLYRASIKDMEQIITACYCQLTGRERDLMDAIKIKFCVINFVFYICWVPNLINGVLLWCLWFKLPVRFIITVWYIMAFTNPLQALFNCLVYRRWSSGSEKVIMPCLMWKNKRKNPQGMNDDVNNKRREYVSKTTTDFEENYPLLKHTNSTRTSSAINKLKKRAFIH